MKPREPVESPAFEMLKAWPEEQLSCWIKLQNGSHFKAGSVLGWGDWSRCPHDVHSNLNFPVILWYRSESAALKLGDLSPCFGWVQELRTKPVLLELHRDESWRGRQQLKAGLRQSIAHSMTTSQWWTPSNTRCGALRSLKPWWDDEGNQSSGINSSWTSTPTLLKEKEVPYVLELITLHVSKFARYLL